MKLPSILSSTMSRDYTLADVYDEKHRHVEDAQSTSIETPLGGTIIRPFVSKRLCRAYLILLPIVFGLGIVLGCTSLSFFKRPEFVPGLRLRTPIPKEIFQQRLKIPFVPDNRYYGSGDAVDKAWKEITSGGDSIWLQNPSDYGLAKGISDPLNIDNTDERFYVLSNLHQLHCVNVVRRRFRHYESQISQPVNESEAITAGWTEHTDHCFEYLRLSITCGDFLVMEPASPPGTAPELTAGGLGWGVVHECIDFDALRKWQAFKRHESEKLLS
ncbi:Protein of unknown function DUF3328 [Penicillium expansum]|uniref:Uncharacterized protein n=1 Tax=Penicillium expansum TaxID=27334 RepID=A0A0A2KF84_PENEN|nr:Protein of unknown function DUF3328 [Penicillium expansum]KGO46258.1 Protein of unknown function DUF3328 [Penicillium expansum]KGO58201.1 Protein of unknown function DUF3328 [Penicillium expansum]KGO63010.1 Protein of unknown function DUF3328 [Penicillium expansum]